MVGLHESLGIDCFWKCSLNKYIRQCRTLKKTAVLKQLTVSFTLVRDSKLDAPSVGAIVIASRGSPAPGIKYKYILSNPRIRHITLQGIISIPPAVRPCSQLAIRGCFILAFVLTEHKGSQGLVGNWSPLNSSWGEGRAKQCLGQVGLRGLWFLCPALCPTLAAGVFGERHSQISWGKCKGAPGSSSCCWSACSSAPAKWKLLSFKYLTLWLLNVGT